MYELGQQITERAEELEERFDADTVDVSHYENRVSFNIGWEDDKEFTEQLERVIDCIENKLPPEHQPDNFDVSGYDNFTLSVGYDFAEVEDAEVEEDANEADNETETETEEE